MSLDYHLPLIESILTYCRLDVFDKFGAISIKLTTSSLTEVDLKIDGLVQERRKPLLELLFSSTNQSKCLHLAAT